MVRDQDGYVYFREYNGCIFAGGYEPEAKPLFDDGIVPGFYFFFSFSVIFEFKYSKVTILKSYVQNTLKLLRWKKIGTTFTFYSSSY